MTMNNVIGEEHRNLQAAAHGGLLHRSVLRSTDGVKRPADAPGGDLLTYQLARHLSTDTDQSKLTDLLLQRHAIDQVIDKGILVIQRGAGENKARGTEKSGERERGQAFHQDRYPASYIVRMAAKIPRLRTSRAWATEKYSLA